MSQKTERRIKLLEFKKEDPFGMKARFIRADVFRDFQSYANSQLNSCGWLFEEGSYDHKLWKLYHCDIEEMNHIYGYKMKLYHEKYGRDTYPTPELKDIFLSYLTKAYELYKLSLNLHQPMNSGQREFYLKWFEKNIKKYETKK